MWDVEQFAGQHITFTNLVETKGTYSQQVHKGRRTPVELMVMPEPGDQAGPKLRAGLRLVPEMGASSHTITPTRIQTISGVQRIKR
jgi:hypothetical protein